jgi:hypothetical protein
MISAVKATTITKGIKLNGPFLRLKEPYSESQLYTIWKAFAREAMICFAKLQRCIRMLQETNSALNELTFEAL